MTFLKKVSQHQKEYFNINLFGHLFFSKNTLMWVESWVILSFCLIYNQKNPNISKVLWDTKTSRPFPCGACVDKGWYKRCDIRCILRTTYFVHMCTHYTSIQQMYIYIYIDESCRCFQQAVFHKTWRSHWFNLSTSWPCESDTLCSCQSSVYRGQARVLHTSVHIHIHMYVRNSHMSYITVKHTVLHVCLQYMFMNRNQHGEAGVCILFQTCVECGCLL